MNYSRIWSNAVPVANDAANQIATSIENVRGDVEERMAALVTGWTTAAPTDPIVVLPALLGNVTGKVITIGYQAGIPLGGATVTYGVNIVTGKGNDCVISGIGSGSYTAQLTIPTGIIITGFAVLLSDVVGALPACRLYKKTFDTVGTVTTIATLNPPVASALTITSNLVLLETVAANTIYSVDWSWTGGNTSKFYGWQITYNTPDCRNTY